MGLRCLLGHDFDEPETERERNEEGNEVVVTVREVKTCNRCGEKQVVSENKEITSIDQLRETATGEPTSSESSTDAESESAEASADGEWRTDDLSTGRVDSDVADTETSVDAGTDETATPTESEPTAEPEPTAASDSEEDPVERGVADIIEQAEKGDDMLQRPSEESESETEPPADESEPTGTEPEATESEPEPAAEDAGSEDDDVPVHPGQRSAEAEASEGPDPESDDGVILDEEEESPPEEARRQWEEEASPEEVPGQDLSITEPSAPDVEDVEIIDGDAVDSTTEPEPEPQSEPAQSDADEPQQPTDTPSAVESEDAEIMDASPEPSGTAEPEPTGQSDEAEPQSEPSATEREETEEGHMPWPDTPGEDEGHDATEPDGEPADVEFGGGFAPSDAEAEEPAEEADATGSIDRIDAPEDRANGHRTEDGETDDASAAPTSNVNLERSSRDARMEYYCPECGLTRDVGNSSMRAGDICPECRVGYITEQQKAE